MGVERYLRELGEAARRAGMLKEETAAIVEEVERRNEEGSRAHRDDEQQSDQIRLESEREAEEKRRAAVASAELILERIAALEQPLNELVKSIRGEMQRVSGELKSAGQETVTQPPLDDDPPRGEEAVIPGRVESVSDAPVAAYDRDAAEAPPPMPLMVSFDPATHAEGETRSPSLRETHECARTGPFITSDGHCAACQRTFMAGSEDALHASGWRISEDLGLCPDCQEQGWQLPAPPPAPAAETRERARGPEERLPTATQVEHTAPAHSSQDGVLTALLVASAVIAILLLIVFAQALS